MNTKRLYITIIVSLLFITEGRADYISLATTTSTENSGFLAYIIPIFEKKFNIKVRTIVQGTDKHWKQGDEVMRPINGTCPCNGKKFIENGYGLRRYPFMFNDFVIIGPKEDPGEIQIATSSVQAFTEIYKKIIVFIEGDNSGTHYKEKQVWEKTGLIPTRKDEWYLSTGSGMGATINTAVAKNGYTFSDRATWLSYKNKNKFEILLEGDPDLFNQYSMIPINADLHPHVRKEKAYEFIRWLTSDQGQNLIKNFKMNNQALFFPNFKAEK